MRFFGERNVFLVDLYTISGTLESATGHSSRRAFPSAVDICGLLCDDIRAGFTMADATATLWRATMMSWLDAAPPMAPSIEDERPRFGNRCAEDADVARHLGR